MEALGKVLLKSAYRDHVRVLVLAFDDFLGRAGETERIGNRAESVDEICRNGGESLLEPADERIFAFRLPAFAGGRVTLPVETVQGADYRLFGEKTGENRHRRLPVVLVDADRLEDRSYRLADHREHRVFAVLVADVAFGVDGVENTEHENHRNNELAGAPDEDFKPLPGMKEYMLGARQMVRGQLHDEVRGLALE